MIEHLHPRIIENKDWATALFVLTFAVVAMTKSAYETRFTEFSKLIFSDKYAKIYRDNSHMKSSFTVGLFFVQVISFAFFIQLTMNIFGQASKTDWILFIQIATFLLYFILAKYLIEKIVAASFNIDDFVELFNLQKVTYRTYIGVLILPINAILFYYDNIPTIVPFAIIGISLCISLYSYFISIKTYQNVIIGKLFYFILYLCALEIAPYYFLYYWITKGSA
ncbi:DUF4271 domain-containing protein [Flavobacterium johnsoniae]|jgi:hypothetical protein|uniref:DUF4271 domain-containing protein n=1 Tax=Flavobacterium johnsoniae (strain ATCC 17061 / DSM 2064 / JCM 8514 / BCRC 14874 / CCUG 350202 / NBRC 14942 / NCIMB 11054 / UW101) TaxID=376686 RepID=A5FMI6_FLAJ1|nr:DUF4271 domain-containing protein [Flavobacterium johnsoniae]ABQ03590.1 hypothetical protein Fjoh_0555 [Flavobacterium johnsoniae UW101]OXE96011.1 DUF4271 domain-containing protein [Flavobacterium johnsoniae UW101]WQG79546.1 DUF4271 domain-containing protein [Flavobacterium johnsoniae UW101]SHL96474.1 protein of unknown function [Flavobacterium johnsoniae]